MNILPFYMSTKFVGYYNSNSAPTIQHLRCFQMFYIHKISWVLAWDVNRVAIPLTCFKRYACKGTFSYMIWKVCKSGGAQNRRIVRNLVVIWNAI